MALRVFLLPTGWVAMSSAVQPNPNFFRCIFCCILGIDPFATSRIQQKMPRTLLHKLSRLTIVNANPGPKPYTLSDGGRLYILVQPDGTKLWRWNCLFAGKTKTMALGTWPEVTEKEARAVHAAARERLRKGLDPMRERREAKALARLRISISNFAACARATSTARYSSLRPWFLWRFDTVLYGHRPVCQVDLDVMP